MLWNSAIPMILQGPKIMTGPRFSPTPLIAAFLLGANPPGNGLAQEIILILRIVTPSLSDNGFLDDEIPPTLFSKVDGFVSIVKSHLDPHVAGHGVGRRYPAHERIIPALTRFTLVGEADDPRFFGVGGGLGDLGLLLPDVHDARLAGKGERILGGVGRVEGCNFRRVGGEFRIGRGDGRAPDHGGVHITGRFHVFLNRGFLGF
mmetsp:Transcript_11648/g.16982  ORF Transcript_11648/g.16982 Transcript_11648/m.16982 type:complete len:204 (+) Transcript_11648:751-1362(+)